MCVCARARSPGCMRVRAPARGVPPSLCPSPHHMPCAMGRTASAAGHTAPPWPPACPTRCVRDPETPAHGTSRPALRTPYRNGALGHPCGSAWYCLRDASCPWHRRRWIIIPSNTDGGPQNTITPHCSCPDVLKPPPTQTFLGARCSNEHTLAPATPHRAQCRAP